MAYISLACIIVSSFVAGQCFALDWTAAGMINIVAAVLNTIVVLLHLED